MIPIFQVASVAPAVTGVPGFRPDWVVLILIPSTVVGFVLFSLFEKHGTRVIALMPVSASGIKEIA